MMHYPSQETLDTINELMPRCSPIGAYCLGVVCCMAWKDGKDPSRQVLEHVARLEHVQDAVQLYEFYRAISVEERASHA